MALFTALAALHPPLTAATSPMSANPGTDFKPVLFFMSDSHRKIDEVDLALMQSYGPTREKCQRQRGKAAALPPSTVTTQPVVARAPARYTKASPTSEAVTSRERRFARK